MVRPYDKPEHADAAHRRHHPEIAENRLAGEGRDHLRNDTESRHDQYINFRVAEEPEQMLEQHRIAAASRIEEVGAKVAVGQQHGDRTAKYRKGE